MTSCNILDRAQDSFLEVSLRIAVAQLDGLMLAGGSAARNGGPAHRAALQPHVGFDRGIAARIQNLPPHTALILACLSPCSFSGSANQSGSAIAADGVPSSGLADILDSRGIESERVVLSSSASRPTTTMPDSVTVNPRSRSFSRSYPM